MKLALLRAKHVCMLFYGQMRGFSVNTHCIECLQTSGANFVTNPFFKIMLVFT